uniref:NADH dehydrogenase subunit 9 n=1 Tax=Marophrys sp. SRT127 TaxID=2488311 RepID=A0A455RDY3_9EUKA|nr:NADH dehydrogenase subunit 9 [Marophrys sp. SRT127]BBH42970.1 NADH dehydrogenase subunit 9 [Marophrys sp. SRT127]
MCQCFFGGGVVVDDVTRQQQTQVGGQELPWSGLVVMINNSSAAKMPVIAKHNAWANPLKAQKKSKMRTTPTTVIFRIEPEKTEFLRAQSFFWPTRRDSSTDEHQLLEWERSLKGMLPFWLQNIVIVKNEIVVYTTNKHLRQLAFFLYHYTNALYHVIPDMTAIDHPEFKRRFEVVYNFLSSLYNSRLRVKTLIDETTPLPSLTSIYNGLEWMERETWDMFGIYFYNHPDLRRILTDYGFDGFPLSKNFPLHGYMEVRYDDEQKRVVNEPIEISQEFRNYDMISPWISRSNIEDFGWDNLAPSLEQPQSEPKMG